jgi:hypothetical protein
MLQSNRADISMFDALQANQHTKTDVSQMAVFNDLNAVKAASDKYAAVVTKLSVASVACSEQQEKLRKEASALSDAVESVADGPEAKAVIDAVNKEVTRIAAISDWDTKDKAMTELTELGLNHNDRIRQLKYYAKQVDGIGLLDVIKRAFRHKKLW